MNEWIRVSERLPYEMGDYLVFTDEKRMYVAFYAEDNIGFILLENDIIEEHKGMIASVTYWMRLPKFPKNEKAYEAMGWISVHDEMPKVGKRVLCGVLIPPKFGGTGRREQRVIAHFETLDGWNCKDIIVTHWRPLPEPPKEHKGDIENETY